MTLSWQISIIDELIRENPEATIGDYSKALSRMGPRQKKLIGPLKRLLWPHLYNPGFRRWPPAKVYDPKTFTMDEKERNHWAGRDQAFIEMIKRTARRHKQRA
jgi:hypothetical protein